MPKKTVDFIKWNFLNLVINHCFDRLKEVDKIANSKMPINSN